MTTAAIVFLNFVAFGLAAYFFARGWAATIDRMERDDD